MGNNIKYIDLFAGIGGFPMWYNKLWQINIQQRRYQKNRSLPNTINRDLLRLRLVESMGLVKKLFIPGLRNSTLNQESLKRKTRMEKITTRGKEIMQVMVHFMSGLENLVEKPINAKFVALENTLNGLILQENTQTSLITR